MFPALEGKFLTTGSPGNFTLKPRFLPLAPLSLMSYTGPIWITHSLALGILMLSVLGLNSQHILGRLASCLTSGKSITQVQPEGIKIERKELSLKSLFKKKKIWLNHSPTFIYQGSHISFRMKWKFLGHKDLQALDLNTSLCLPHPTPPSPHLYYPPTSHVLRICLPMQGMWVRSHMLWSS